MLLIVKMINHGSECKFFVYVESENSYLHAAYRPQAYKGQCRRPIGHSDISFLEQKCLMRPYSQIQNSMYTGSTVSLSVTATFVVLVSTQSRELI